MSNSVMSDQCAGQWFLRASGLGDDEFEVGSVIIFRRFFKTVVLVGLLLCHEHISLTAQAYTLMQARKHKCGF